MASIYFNIKPVALGCARSASRTAMQNAEQKMSPVLAVFSDQVLFLKHNLNARAIASIQNEVTRMEKDVANLIEDMNRAIGEAEAFVEQLKQ